jgi:dephospho-CoA kinase
MGKSTVAMMLRELNIPVFDADAAVHALQGVGGALVPAIEVEFPGTTGAEGVLRQELGARVFGDPEALAKLEAIVHPAVANLREMFMQANATASLVVFDIPLLYEKGLGAGLDAVAVVTAPAVQQRQRVLARPGMTPERFSQILGIQVPDAQKRARADYVIDTSVTFEATKATVAALVDTILQKNQR